MYWFPYMLKEIEKHYQLTCNVNFMIDTQVVAVVRGGGAGGHIRIHVLSIIISFHFSFIKKVNKLEQLNGSTEYSKENKTVPGKVATTHTEDRHKQDT